MANYHNYKSRRRVDRNPKNPTSRLFKKLTRIFSGPMSQYKRQTPQQEKRKQLSRFSFDNPAGQTFAHSKNDPFSYMYSRNFSEAARLDRYSDFEQMEFEPIIARALNTYAYEITATTGMKPLLTIECDNEPIKLILEDLFYNILNVRQNLFGWCRGMCKKGDFMLYLDVKAGKGIRNALGLPCEEIEILQGEDETNPNYVQYQWNQSDFTFEAFQIAHFRIPGLDKHSPYGSSVLDPVRRTWRQLQLLENHMISYRIVRSTDRRVFYLQVGNVAPQDVEQYVEKVATQFKRAGVADPTTGRVDLRYNPASIEEDFFIPVRGEHGSKIDVLKGGDMTAQIEDVKYIAEKMYTGLNIPQSYLSRGEGADEGGSNLAQKDITFANVILQIQQHVVAELVKIAQVHLTALGYEGKDLLSFDIKLNNPSKLAKMQELENLRLSLDVANLASESGFYSRREIAMKILDKTPKEFERTQLERFYDAKYDARLEAMATMAEGGMGGEFGSDLGELPDMDDLPSMEDEMGAEGGTPGDGVLLAAPGPSEYEPTTSDKRSGMGPRRRSMNSKGSAETAKATPRQLQKGSRGLRQTGQGISERRFLDDYFGGLNKILLESNRTAEQEAIETVDAEMQTLNERIRSIFGEDSKDKILSKIKEKEGAFKKDDQNQN